MTTTASTQNSHSGTAVLRGAAWGGVAAAVLAAVVALFADGRPALVGSLIGGAATVAVLALGTYAVLVVARRNPMLSLLVALVVYTAQGLLLVVALGLVSQLTDGPEVVAAALTVCAVTIVWTTMFAVFAKRERIVLFEVPGRDAE